MPFNQFVLKKCLNKMYAAEQLSQQFFIFQETGKNTNTFNKKLFLM
jgi:hypothetical protein